MMEPIHIAILFLAQLSGADIRQTTTGPCSPAVANVAGDVTVTCIGVDPRALARLNAELVKKKLRAQAAAQQANSWTERYLSLEKALREYKGDRAMARQAEEYLHQGDLEAAGKLLDRVLAKDAADEHSVASAHYNLARVFELQFEPLKAIPELKKAHEYSPKDLIFADAYSRALLDADRFGESFQVLERVLPDATSIAKDDSKLLAAVASMREQMGELYQQFRRYNDALGAFQEQLGIERQLSRTDPARQREAGRALDHIGITQMNRQHPAEAGEAFQQALSIATQGGNHPEDTASVEYHLAMLNGSQGKFSEVPTLYNDALGKYRSLAADNPVAFRGKLAEVLRGAGQISYAMGRYDSAEQALVECIRILDDLGANNAEPYLARRAQARVMLGRVEQERREIGEAAALYDEASVIYNAFDDEKITAYIPQIAALQEQTGDLYKSFDMFEKAKNEYRKALPIFRRLANQNPDVYTSEIATILDNLAAVSVRLDETDDARSAVDEALKIRRELSAQQPAKYRDALGQSLITKAMVIRGQHAGCAEINTLTSEALRLTSRDTIAKGAKDALRDCGGN